MHCLATSLRLRQHRRCNDEETEEYWTQSYFLADRCTVRFIFGCTAAGSFDEIFGGRTGNHPWILYLGFCRKRFSPGFGKQLSGGSSISLNSDSDCLCSGLRDSLHQSSEGTQAVYQSCCNVSDVSSDHHLWLCHHLFVQKTGIDHSTAGQTAV